jgi:hypothetical protein
MRRAHQKGVILRSATIIAPPAKKVRGTGVAKPGYGSASILTSELPAAESKTASRGGSVSAGETGGRSERHRQLPIMIRKRIETRLRGRVRNLSVRLLDDTVVLEGQCATYYTKQLAQHAALGVLEDEHLTNSIVVNVPR